MLPSHEHQVKDILAVGGADAARAAAQGGPPEPGGTDAARAATRGGSPECGGADAARTNAQGDPPEPGGTFFCTVADLTTC